MTCCVRVHVCVHVWVLPYLSEQDRESLNGFIASRFDEIVSRLLAFEDEVCFGGSTLSHPSLVFVASIPKQFAHKSIRLSQPKIRPSLSVLTPVPNFLFLGMLTHTRTRTHTSARTPPHTPPTNHHPHPHHTHTHHTHPNMRPCSCSIVFTAVQPFLIIHLPVPCAPADPCG